jgi:hypothetical protein
MDFIRWHDPFNRFPTWVYNYRHPDPEIDAATRITPWDFIPENWMDELDDDDPWMEDDSWLEEDYGNGWPDPNDW